jgi:hypothetical protein
MVWSSYNLSKEESTLKREGNIGQGERKQHDSGKKLHNEEIIICYNTMTVENETGGTYKYNTQRQKTIHRQF